MPQRSLGLAAAAMFLVISLPASGAEKNSTGFSREELENICALAQDVCRYACRRSDSFSGQLSQSLCEDQCLKDGANCIASIPRRQKNKGTTGVGANRKPAAKAQ